MRTNESPRLTLLQGGAGEGESGSAFTTYGPVKAGLTTSHRIQSQALSESLNSLERGIDDLESRYLEVCATFTGDILPRVVRLLSTQRTDITNGIQGLREEEAYSTGLERKEPSPSK